MGYNGKDITILLSFLFIVPPRVTVDKDQVFIIPGGSTLVQCLAVGIPPPVIMWNRDKKVLGPGGRVHANDAGELVINKAMSDDAGNYSCTARSAGGSTTVTVQVSVGGKLSVTHHIYNFAKRPIIVYENSVVFA